MTYYGAKELAASFQLVRSNTLTIAEEIGEENYGFRATPETRTVAQTLVHLAVITRMPLQLHKVEARTSLEGFDFMSFFGALIGEESAPRTKAEVIALLKEEGDKFASWLGGLSEEFLAQEVTFPAGMTPPVKTRFEMLMSAKEHEMHHRAQLMVMERMLGQVPHLTRRMQEFIAARQAEAAKASA